MAWPAPEDAQAWLQAQDIPAAEALTLLRAAGGRPEDALLYAGSGRDPQSWRKLPRAMQRGELSLVADWSPAQLIDALHKLCHDLMVHGVGAAPRYFAATDLPAPPVLPRLKDWQQELVRESRTAEHPYNNGLMLEALVSRAQSALN
jgi:DNA polymerase-3 subunit delta'